MHKKSSTDEDLYELVVEMKKKSHEEKLKINDL